MGKLERYFERAKALSPEGRAEFIEHVEAFFEDPDLSPEQMAELRRRMALPDRKYVGRETVEVMFGRRIGS